MLIYFLRHGETMWNRESRIQGTTPYTDLTDFGVRLAELTLDGITARDLKFDRVYVSPLRRAMHTAEIVMRGQTCPLIVDDRVREMSFGKYEGTRIGDGLWEDDNIRSLFRNPPAYVPPPGAEALDDVLVRFTDFLEKEIMPLEGTCGNVLVVCHGGIMRTVLRYMLHTPVEKYWDGRQPNCCVHIVSLKDGNFTLEEQSAVFYDSALAAKVPSV